MQDDLLGYLLGALEAEEQKRIEQYLESRPHARRHLEILRRGMEPLEGDDGHFDAPDGLAWRTCRFIWLSVE